MDVVAASSNLTVLGGPASVTVNLDLGSPGQRGSQIYTGVGKPTDPGISLPSVLVNDLYINLNPSSIEYLYLYQYGITNGIAGWTRVLRLVPNTALINPAIRFINGEAHTVVSYNGSYLAIRGQYFPIGELFGSADLGNLTIKDFNIQHSIISDVATSSSVSLGTISPTHNIEFLSNPVTGEYSQIPNFPFGVNTLSMKIFASETNALGESTPVNGFKIVHFLATVGGRSTDVVDFNITDITFADPLIPDPGSLEIIGHGISTGEVVAYMNNANSDIGGLENNEQYLVYTIDTDNIRLLDIATSDLTAIPPVLSFVSFIDSGAEGQHSLVTFPEVG